MHPFYRTPFVRLICVKQVSLGTASFWFVTLLSSSPTLIAELRFFIVFILSFISVSFLTVSQPSPCSSLSDAISRAFTGFYTGYSIHERDSTHIFTLVNMLIGNPESGIRWFSSDAGPYLVRHLSTLVFRSHRSHKKNKIKKKCKHEEKKHPSFSRGYFPCRPHRSCTAEIVREVKRERVRERIQKWKREFPLPQFILPWK